MIHLQSNQRLYISEDLRGYVDKLIDDGIIPYAVDFLQLGFAQAVKEELAPAINFNRHEITTNTSILGNDRLILEAVAQWYARELEAEEPNNNNELLHFICSLAITGGRSLKDRWQSRGKGQIQTDILSISIKKKSN